MYLPVGSLTSSGTNNWHGNQLIIVILHAHMVDTFSIQLHVVYRKPFFKQVTQSLICTDKIVNIWWTCFWWCVLEKIYFIYMCLYTYGMINRVGFYF